MKHIPILAAALVASFAAHASDTIESKNGDTYTAYPRTLNVSKLANGTVQYDMLWQYHLVPNPAVRHLIGSDQAPQERRVQVSVTGCDRGMGDLWEDHNPLTTNKWLREGTQVFDALALKTCALAQEASK